jgi:hypothetical protein
VLLAKGWQEALRMVPTTTSLLANNLGGELMSRSRSHGQIIALEAEPGVGDSHLFYESKAIPNQAGGTGNLLGVRRQGVGPSATAGTALILFRISRDEQERKRREHILGKVLELQKVIFGKVGNRLTGMELVTLRCR